MIQPTDHKQPIEGKRGLRPLHTVGVVVAFAILVIIAFTVLSAIAGVVWTILKLAIIVAIVFLLARFLMRRSRA